MRFRIRSLLVAVVIVALLAALVVQNRTANRREAALRAEIEKLRYTSEIARLGLMELDAQHKQEMARRLSRQKDRDGAKD